MDEFQQAWNEEQRRVDDVTELIRKRVEDIEQSALQLKGHVVEIRKNFWEDVTINREHMDDWVESYWSMKQQAEVLAERERSHAMEVRQLKQLERMRTNPYFGRIDFREDGEQAAERIYIGLSSFTDEDGITFYVYDWRAPVSSLFYDIGIGPASYRTPEGAVAGELALKRQFMIRDARIEAMFDTNVTIGDEMLLQALGRHADDQMKSIVATIQREQNRIIRNETSRLLIVQGAAGSGKTSAALQRVAYLLYRYRNQLTADQIVLFSPNPLFSSYISNVLPELGEENMLQTTFQDYLHHRLNEDYQLEDPYDALEYTLTRQDDPNYDARLSAIRFKGSAAFAKLIRMHAERLSRDGLPFKTVSFRRRPIFEAEWLQRKFYQLPQKLTIPDRLRQLSEWMLEELKAFEKEEAKKDWVQEEIQYLDTEDYQKVYKEMRKREKQGKLFNSAKLEQQLLARLVVRRELKRIRDRIAGFRFVDYLAAYRRLFEVPELAGELPAEWDAICAITVSRLNEHRLDYEDASPFLLLKDIIAGFPEYGRVRHVLIDEAQDYTPFQFEYVRLLFPRSRFTLLGDFNQAIFRHSQTPLHEYVTAEEGTETIRLTKSYRSTKQIVEFTRLMLEDGDQIEPFERNGPMPLIVRAEEARELDIQLRELQDRGYGMIAVIGKTAEHCEKLHEALNADFELQLVTKQTATFQASMVVIPVYLAKGVEFDAVIIPDASADVYGEDADRKLLYTACTRAMHELRLIVPASKRLSPIIEHIQEPVYEWRGRREAASVQ